MKEYELTSKQADLAGEGYKRGWWFGQKKLLEYLRDNDLLAHTSFTKLADFEDCLLCQLLKDFGLGG